LHFLHSNTIGTPVLTVEDVITSFPQPILPTVQEEPEYKTIQAIHKLLQVNARAIDNHLGGGGALGHLCIIVSVTAYAIVAPLHPWENPSTARQAP
jgi:hypothetical protein